MSTSSEPWYRTTVRWGQTNLIDSDPRRYDDAWWRTQWKRTRVQGVIVNAGGIVAYYPSEVPFHYQAAGLDGRDLYGEIVRSPARTASRSSPAWIRTGSPTRFTVASELDRHRRGRCALPCGRALRHLHQLAPTTRVSSADHAGGDPPHAARRLFRQQLVRPAPHAMCHCPNCRDAFFAYAKLDLPRRRDCTDESYRQWINWNYQRRNELWDLNNRSRRKRAARIACGSA